MIRARSRAALLLAAVLLLGLAFAPRAAGSIYWANDKGTTIGTRQPRRDGGEPELHHRRAQPLRGGGRRRPRLLGRQRTTGTIGRANLDGTGVNQGFIGAGTDPCGVAVDGAHVYWANLHRRDDRPRQPRRLRRQPELHRRRQLPLRSRGRRRPRLLGQPRSATRSAAPTSTARARTRASSPAPTSPAGSRSTAPTSTGPTATTGRSVAPTSTAPASTRASSPAGTARAASRSTAPTSTGPTTATGHIGRANLDGTGVNQSFITGATGPCGVAVDVPPSAALARATLERVHPRQAEAEPAEGHRTAARDRPRPRRAGSVRQRGRGRQGRSRERRPRPDRGAAGDPARGAKLRKLIRTGRVAVRPKISYTPDGGDPSTRSTGITLIRR